MARRPIAARRSWWARALCRWLTRAGVTPNQISIASVVFAGAAAGALVVARSAGSLAGAGWFTLAALSIQLRLLANLLDGMVAIEGGCRTKSGELFNDAPDRLSDTVILVGAGFSIAGHPWGGHLGWAAAVLAVTTAYVRALGASLGTRHLFVGPMGKPHRMAVLTGACLVAAIEAVTGATPHAIAIALGIVSVGCVVTIAVRLRSIARDLEER